MKFLTVLVIVQGLFLASGILGQNTGGKTRARPCNTPFLKNGMVRLRSKGKFSRFVCNSDYIMHGNPVTVCANGRWEGDIPICIAPGCNDTESPANGTISVIKRGAAIKLTCSSRYELVGNAEAYCDGTEWDRQIGKCRETNISAPLFCDFEGKKLCGWSNYLQNEKYWLHTNIGRFGIGPQHDHTKTEKYEGFFMLLEGDSPRYPSPNYLMSPMYDASVSNNSCVKFYYHMYGVATGVIRVFVKTAKQSDSSFFASLRKAALIEIANRSSNVWVEALVRLPKLGDNFQIVIQGELMRNQRTDIAIDDVEILDGGACDEDKAVVTVKPESEEGGVYDVQSCQDRCDETSSVTGNSTRTGNILKCDCFDGCTDSDTCCPDFEQICIFGDTTMQDTTTIATTIKVKSLTSTSTGIPTLPTTTTPTTKKPTRPTTTTPPPPTAKTTRKPYVPIWPKPQASTEESDILEFDVTTINYMNDDYKSVEFFSGNGSHKSDKLTNMVAEDTGVSTQGIIVSVVLFTIVMLAVTGGLYVYRERTRVQTPAEMKKKYNKNCRSANEEFSEIRFLTEDEQLDFTLATPIED